ncbi:MAG: type 4a pilus biogenesis protein PilO [Nitrospirae bacterium]|nr:type 4a pilus biogenesis protein PilO [Nitrospirota bacterium]
MAINININFSRVKKLPVKLQVLIVAIPCLVLLALFIFLVLLPKHKEIRTLDARIAKLNQEIAGSEAMVKRLDVLIEENKMLKTKLAKLKEQLPEEKEVSELLRQTSELGLQSGLEILLWRPEAKKTSPDYLYVEIPVKVEVLTGYHNLGVFFSHISRLPRLVNISGIELRVKEKKGAGEGDITAAFTARTFASVSPEELSRMKAAEPVKDPKGQGASKGQAAPEKK